MNVIQSHGEFDFIFHISDIHIRLNSRKEEYNTVFEQLYTIIKHHSRVNHAVIVITGDLLHNKIDLTPECILMSYSFLRELGLIAPTILIAGNHDALLNNRQRMDSITSILHARTPSNVYYLKDSGYYAFGNIVFAVNSLLQENPDEWLDIDRDKIAHSAFFKHKKCIGLYHGQICGWKNNIGFSSETGDKQVDDFPGLELVLLGDIHKHQYMNADKTMAYSGSLISQNFGETDPDHGVLCWDLQTKTSELIVIPNPYCFCEAVLEDETLELLYYPNVPLLDWKNPSNLSKYLQPHCNLRVYMTQDSKLNHDFTKMFKKVMPNARLQQKFASSKQNNTIKSQLDFYPDATNEPFWIRTFVLEKLDGNPIPVVEKLIQDLLSEFRKNVTLQKTHEATDWEIEQINFDYLFGYGKDNKIDFKKLQSNTITGIFGHNSFGKSTIIDILAFLLFGKITRGTTGNTIPREIINHLEKKAFGELIFKVGNQRYKIVKNCSRTKAEKIKIVEQLLTWQGTCWVDCSEEHRKKTDKIIESLLGNLESFLFTNVCLQQKEKPFRENTQKDKKEFLYTLFGLDWFEKYRKTKEDLLKSFKGEEKVYKEKVGESSTQEWEEKAKSLVQLIDNLVAELTEMETLQADLDVERENFLKSQQNSVYENLESAQQVLTSCKQKLVENASTIEKLELEKTQFAEYIAKHDLYALKRDLERLNDQIANYENSVQILDTEEAKKWTLQTKKEWTQFYIKVQDTLSRSEIIAQTWNERKEAIQKEIHILECASISFEKSLVNVADWENLSVKIKKIEQDIPLLEQKMLETAPDIPVQLEEMISKFQELFHEFEKHQCKIQSLRLQLKDTGKMQINPDCKACIKNSSILKQALQEKELQERERNEQDSIQKMKKLAQQISVYWTDVANHSTVEEINSFLRKKLEHCKQEKVDFAKRKETTQKKLTLYLALQQNYINTKNFKLVEENNQKLADLKKRLTSDPAKKEYEDMLVFFKNTKIYQEVAQYWEKQNDVSLTDLKQKQEKICKTISKYEKRVQRLAETEKLLSEISTSMLKDELELKSIQEQIQILKNNQKLNKKLQELDVKKASNKAILDDKTRLLHKYQTDLEKNTIYKREWEINMERWKNCKETIDTMQLLVNCIDRDGLPLYLLKMYLPMIENEINQLIYTFLDKKMVLRVVDKDVIVGVEACSDNVSNYLGGMESFMVDLSLKMVFSKFSRQPKSNFFIIDEGISVLDQERLSNIHVLFNFLTSISEQVFLISHIPSIKDFVTQSIEIMKDEKGYSHANCFF